jgi:hypothetical protein
VYLIVVFVPLLLVVTAVPTARSDAFYLSRVGPPPLRFSSLPKPKSLALINPQVAVTNPAAVTTSEPDLPVTNAITTASTPQLSDTQTNSPAGTPAPETSIAGPLITPETQIPLSTNLLPAGNLLLVTPQVLADFFKANMDATYRAATNGAGDGEIPFIPPLSRPLPSSEAVYRVE